jgi:hypothetical protein
MEKRDYSKQGKKSRAAGARFEARVRVKLEEMGWVVDKWTNTVDSDREGKIGKIVPAKRKYNPFKKVMVIGTGFPDFVAFKRNEDNTYEVVGVEVKSNGYLTQGEKTMCMWLLQNKIFTKVLIAKKGKKRGEIEYIDFREKHGKKFL